MYLYLFGVIRGEMSLHGKRKEIYKYEAPWTVYAMNWSVRPDKRFRLALGSFVEEYNNKVSVLVLSKLLFASVFDLICAGRHLARCSSPKCKHTERAVR